ncbi:MAG: diguanylate cyclase [Limnothrix sp. RL_2_0]|nr:diguanylate cyclase [Limnothrix sp. RL_2_0]
MVIENLDCLFAYSNTAREVLPLFRTWYEDARRTPIWSKFNLIVTYALEIYITLDVQQSPFNVGLPITLEGFTIPNILELAKHYQLPWNLEIAEYLYHMLGRHPHLIRLTIEHFASQKNLDITNQNWQNILALYFKNSLHNDSIYRGYFSRWWNIISRHANLFDALGQLLNDPAVSIELPAMTAYNLEYLGLVSREGSTVMLRGELYRQYFQAQVAQLEQLLTNLNESSLQAAINHERLQQLEQENFELRSLAERDGLTNLYNRRSFDAIFAARWQAAQAEGQGLMLLLCDVDFFKRFNDTYGHDVGDEVLKKVAQVLLCVKNDFSDCAARYGGEEFVLLRLVKDPPEAIALAEKIRLDVAALDLSTLNNQKLSPPPKITISIGVVLYFPKLGQDRQAMFKKADEMLYKAKSNGRNQSCCHFQDSPKEVWI